MSASEAVLLLLDLGLLLCTFFTVPAADQAVSSMSATLAQAVANFSPAKKNHRLSWHWPFNTFRVFGVINAQWSVLSRETQSSDNVHRLLHCKLIPSALLFELLSVHFLRSHWTRLAATWSSWKPASATLLTIKECSFCRRVLKTCFSRHSTSTEVSTTPTVPDWPALMARRTWAHTSFSSKTRCFSRSRWSSSGAVERSKASWTDVRTFTSVQR